jgi:hypothetical protein
MWTDFNTRESVVLEYFILYAIFLRVGRGNPFVIPAKAEIRTLYLNPRHSRESGGPASRNLKNLPSL